MSVNPVKSTDGGITWNLDTAGVSGLFPGGLLASDYYADELGGQHSSVWPGTSSWFPYKKSVGGNWTVDTAGMKIDPASGDGQLALSGDGNGNLYCCNSITGMFRRPVTGTVWTPDTAGLGIARITRLCRGKNGDMYGSALNGNYFVRRGGAWKKVNSPPGVSIRFTSAISVDGMGSFFVAGRGGFPDMGLGVFFTKNDGISWAMTDLDSLIITSMVSYGDSTYVITDRRGIYLVNTSGTTGIQSRNQTPMTFILMQNYPNPFNPSTTIRYGLAQRSHVILAVYSTLGQKVAVPANEDMEAGFHDVKFDGSALASGIYIYRIQAGNFVQARKFVLLH